METRLVRILVRLVILIWNMLSIALELVSICSVRKLQIDLKTVATTDDICVYVFVCCTFVAIHIGYGLVKYRCESESCSLFSITSRWWFRYKLGHMRTKLYGEFPKTRQIFIRIFLENALLLFGKNYGLEIGFLIDLSQKSIIQIFDERERKNKKSRFAILKRSLAEISRKNYTKRTT